MQHDSVVILDYPDLIVPNKLRKVTTVQQSIYNNMMFDPVYNNMMFDHIVKKFDTLHKKAFRDWRSSLSHRKKVDLKRVRKLLQENRG